MHHLKLEGRTVQPEEAPSTKVLRSGEQKSKRTRLVRGQ
jgi:hypothetical protein